MRTRVKKAELEELAKTLGDKLNDFVEFKGVELRVAYRYNYTVLELFYQGDLVDVIAAGLTKREAKKILLAINSLLDTRQYIRQILRYKQH